MEVRNLKVFATQHIKLLTAASLCGFLLKQMLCWAFHTFGAKLKWQGSLSLTREGYWRLFMTSQMFMRQFLKKKKKLKVKLDKNVFEGIGEFFWSYKSSKVHLAKTLESANVRLKCGLCLWFILESLFLKSPPLFKPRWTREAAQGQLL